MKHISRIISLLFISFLIGQPAGVVIDQTTIDIANYWNTTTNQIFIDENNNVFIGYNYSDNEDGTFPKVKIKNVTENEIYTIDDSNGFGLGMPDIRKHNWGNLLVTTTSGGFPWVLTDDWANGVSLQIESEQGLGEFEELYWFNEAPVSEPEFALTGWTLIDSNGRIHSLIYDGWGFGFVYKYSDDGGFVFSQGVIIAYEGDDEFPNYTVVEGQFFNQPFGVAFNSDDNGHVAIAVTDQGGDITLYESFNGGELWENARNITNYGEDFGGEISARPDRFIDGIFDAEGNLHLVWEASYWMDEWQESERHPWPGYGVDLPYPADKRGQLIHWSENSGLNLVAVSQYPLVDLSNVFSNITGREKGCMISQPSISVDETNNEIIIGYTQYSENYGDISQDGKFLGFGKAYITKSTDGGESWTIPYALNESTDFDERHLQLSEKSNNNEINLIYYHDETPGYNVFQEINVNDGVDIMYHSMEMPEMDIAIYSCMDSDAVNFDSDANLDDGTCLFITCCADINACNYESSCLPFQPQECDYLECLGCMDPDATNYDPFATMEDESCLYGTEFALKFDGTNDFVLIEDHNDFDFTTNYTLEAWIFPEEFNWLSGIISKYQTSSANGWLLRMHSTEPFDGISFDELNSPVGVLYQNQWTHIAAVNQNGQRNLYINGEAVNLSGNALNVQSNNDYIRIGSDFNDRYFKGAIDEIRIWNTGLNQTQIQANMNEPLLGNEQNLIAYYNFNEGLGDTLHDLTGNNHYGIVYNGAVWVNGVGGAILLGDVNFDGNINILDLVMKVAFIVGFEEPNDFQFTASDGNESGSINIQDIIFFLNIILEN